MFVVYGDHTLAVYGYQANKMPEEFLPESVDDSGTITATEVT